MPRAVRADPYDHPLYYDIINTPGTAEDVTVLQRLARRHLPRAHRAPPPANILWLEPACGTGRYLRVLARRGCRALGIDLSPGMVAFARAEIDKRSLAPRARVLRADMRRMNSPAIRRALRSLSKRPRPILAFCLHNTVRHLPSDRDLVHHLQSLARLLGPRGLYIVGLGLLGPHGEVACETVALARRGRLTIREVIDFVPPEFNPHSNGRASRTERAYRVLSISGPDDVRQIESRYTLRTYTLEQWRRVLGRAGMREIAVTDSWGDPLPSTRCAYALRLLTPIP